MPGIVGLITKWPRARAEQELSRMLRTIRHEPFYETGTWIDESLGVYLGWTARENSFCSGMPLRNERGDVVLVFSGEEFPEAGLIPSLKQHGHEIGTDAPSYLVHVYEEDSAFPAGLNGRFHGMVIDRTRGKALLFNDRYGIHRIYYHESKEAFCFSVEAKAILAVHPELRTADMRSLGELISCGCVLENRTIFEGIRILPPASAWVFENGCNKEKGTYFQPQDWETQEALDSETYYQELRETFVRTLPRYFGGKQRIGMSLTGGLDTRMIMAWQRSASGSLPCYSFGGVFRECEDVKLARKVAKECEQPFEVIPLGNEFLSQFPSYAERTVYLTDGCAGVRNSADLYLNQKAASIAPIRMTGNYGGEILRQLRAFKPVKPATDLYRPEILSQVEEAERTYTKLTDCHAVSFSAFRQTPWYHYGLLALEESQLSLRSPFLDNNLVRAAYRMRGAAAVERNIFKDHEESVRLIADGNPKLARIRTDRGIAGHSGRMEAWITRSLLEFTFKAEYAYDYGMPQWMAKLDHDVSWFHLERFFLGRHKFAHFRVWYRDALSEYVRQMLLDSRTLTRPYLQGRRVEAVVNGHIKGNANYTLEIHQLLNLELIHRLFFDTN